MNELRVNEHRANEHRDWRKQLSAIWPEWNRRIEQSRHKGLSTPLALPFPPPGWDPEVVEPNRRPQEQQLEIDTDSWIAIPALWTDMSRGLGEYARFALMRYLELRDATTQFNPKTVGRLSTEDWVCFVNEAVDDPDFLTKGKQGWFDSQVRDRPDDPALKRAKRLQPLFENTRLWPALAHAVNTYLTVRDRRDRSAVSAEILRNGRFAGPTAIIDFITYLNTGRIPLRQSPFPDELSDLGVAFPKAFTPEVTFLPSDERRALIADLATHLADPEVDGIKSGGACSITSLWSKLQPHGLIATCQEVVAKYAEVCSERNLRRLPIVYVPVGLDSKRHYVSRRAVVRDMFAKLRIARARFRGEREIPRQLAENPTGAAVDRAIGEIRAELAAHPALIIFGIHQVTPSTRFSAIAEEILDAPLHFIIDRLMTETGVFGSLTPPQNAYASRYWILADDKLEAIANLEVKAYKLPQCPPEQFVSLLRWTRVAQLPALRAATERSGKPLADIVSNEIELLIFEAILTFAARSGESTTTAELTQRAIQLLWGPTAVESGKERTEQLLAALIDHLLQQAKLNSDAAWFATILHAVTLLPGGIRLFTVARALAGYVMATVGAHPGTEAELWTVPLRGVSRKFEVDSLSQLVCDKVLQFETLAAGLVRSFPSAAAAGFDEYAHPFETPEVPAFELNFPDNKLQLEFVSPFVRRVFCEQFRNRLPAQHALLNRSIAEEFIRRAAIVQCHCQEKDVRSLVDKRYLVIAIHCALQSVVLENLQPRTNKLLTAPGATRLHWRIPAHSRIKAYHWIYRWLYVEQLNSSEQALSQEYGAELLKQALLEELLESDPLKVNPEKGGPRAKGFLRHPGFRGSLKHFGIITDLLSGLIYVSVRTSNIELARETFQRLDGLVRLVKEETQRPEVSSEWQLQWRQALLKVERDTFRLRLDATVSYEAAFSAKKKSDPLSWSWMKLLQGAKQALSDPSSPPARWPAEVVGIVKGVIRENRKLQPPAWLFGPAVTRLCELIPEDTIPDFYAYLCRFAELVAGTAEPIADDDLRALRRTRTLILFELAETLRIRYASGPFRETVLKVSSRSFRNAARVCLSLGRYFGDDWYYERAADYCFHVGGNKSQRIERIALLITQAITIRFRASSPEQLALAMAFLKTAERALINHPDRIQLFMRFYLERAKLFKEWARQTDFATEEARWCVYYCRADVAALRRLARGRPAWLERATRVLKKVPEWPVVSSDVEPPPRNLTPVSRRPRRSTSAKDARKGPPPPTGYA